MTRLLEKIAAVKKPTLHEKVDKLTKTVSAGAKKSVEKVKKPYVAKKLGLVGAGVAGTSALVAKVRAANMEQQ